ncbi:uncharacterized protein LOC101863829 isoform X3 [Aplysia californica]|uniref:Uncharacterized protein LOC101863829 isoform X3 n=1 Tax=Aplysia californica TaxID=6500 RepID=A0ABM1A4C1_APLCA|nr:uncharacterized protein LOC101863829 isoform X3 [Aplysia californica]
MDKNSFRTSNLQDLSSSPILPLIPSGSPPAMSFNGDSTDRVPNGAIKSGNLSLHNYHNNNNNNNDPSCPPPPAHRKVPVIFTKKASVNMNPMPDDDKALHGPTTATTTSYQDTKERETYDHDPYLTPSDPPFYMESSFSSLNDYPQSPTSEASGFSDNLKMRGRRSQRFDSGVEDCDSLRGSKTGLASSMPAATSSASSYPRLSTHYEQHYEDIDQYRGNNKPIQRSSTDKTALSNDFRTPNELLRLPQVNIAGITHSDSEDGDHIQPASIAEMVSCPTRGQQTSNREVYSPSESHLYSPLEGHKPVPLGTSSSPGRGACCCLAFALLILFCISMAALGISIYLLLNNQNGNEARALPSTFSTSSIPSVSSDNTLQQLKEEINLLKAENYELRELVRDHKLNLSLKIQPLEQDVSYLVSKQDNFSSTLHSVETRLETQIAEISLKPGPQGRPGVANFSLCSFHQFIKSAPSSSSRFTDTDYYPNEEILNKTFVIFAYCSYNGATSVQLESKKVSEHYQYRCVCRGYAGETLTRCGIHYWACPREQ